MVNGKTKYRADNHRMNPIAALAGHSGLCRRWSLINMKKANQIIAVLILTILFSFNASHAESPKSEMDYYKQWIGCKAPPIRFIECDRLEYMKDSPKGKKNLLYSFNSGDFVNGPNEEKLLAELVSLKKALSQASETVIVLGFTYGAMFSPCLNNEGTVIPKNIEELARFPVINLNSRRDDSLLGEPYILLKRCGAIVIDKNGVITKIISHPLSEKDFMDAINSPPWKGKIKQTPSDTSYEINDKKMK